MITMKMRKIKNIVAYLMVGVMAIIGTSVNTFAAEAEGTERTEDDVTIIELNFDDAVPVDDIDLASPCYQEIFNSDEPAEPSSTAVKYDFVNKAGYTSEDLYLPFTVASACLGNAYVIVALTYSDGTTGTVKCTVAQYSGNVSVDGVARTLVYGGNFFPGNYAFKTSGISKQASYVVKIYAGG